MVVHLVCHSCKCKKTCYSFKFIKVVDEVVSFRTKFSMLVQCKQFLYICRKPLAMHFDIFNKDTIVAVSTPPGVGAIALIRMSGSLSMSVLQKIFKTNNKSFNEGLIQSHHQYFGSVFDDDELLDEVLVSVFFGPHSYTGEDMVEISCHGSDFIQEQLLLVLMKEGVRLAEPGEFTMRAFFNKKMDLAQAEAVADLIASHSKASHDLALQQMRGGFSEKITRLRQRLVELAALMELELDFSEEDVEFADRNELDKLLDELLKEIRTLIDSFQTGNVIKKGIPVAIIGKPNVGKSTLLNAILNEERAIVSDIPGTTRDVIEDTIVIEGFSFRFIDTAGLRESFDEIESMGIERTYEKIKQASVILYVCDLTQCKGETAEEMLSEFTSFIQDKEKHFILIGNKIDQLEKIPPHFREMVELETIFISAKRKENIHLITDSLVQSARKNSIQIDTIVSNIRHYHALEKSAEALQSVADNLHSDIPTDLLAIDMRTALYHLGSITGTIYTEEILGTIFSKFCIGK